ncbi:MAG TPA: Hsp70 family protein [Anaeromyxobacteraceae bacterium]|jgi:molecular chaperone DnaK|nr:Hsp70 family protein [Anaeromyxobacteraceae bacterium]
MARTTIDFGIDLGTTNSEIAVLRGTEVEVFKDNEGFEFTPSAVWMDPKNRLWVGRQAREKLEDDPQNAFCEFKLQMGTPEEKVFQRSGRRMSPEMLSAEVLKELRSVVKHRTGEDVEGAVITVPAAFELPQSDATNKAAQLAGLKQSPLLQEPVAAALAYGFQSLSDRVFWLVYDFGGGTFDAAVIQVRDGVIQVVNHGGDNHLGGKLIDWALVDELFIPAVRREFGVRDFGRANPLYTAAIAKLKLEAEKAKVKLSARESVELSVGLSLPGNPQATFDFEIKRADLERIAEPFILRSVNICRKVLSDKRLAASAIERLILVGGPTLMPYLRSRLADAVHGLGIQLEAKVDPLTVVARGAAVFAGTQRNKSASAPIASGAQYTLELEYKPIGPDTEPVVGGRVVGKASDVLTGYTIEFVNTDARPPWKSGKIGLAPTGTFVTNLWAERGRANKFEIVLCDATGRKLPTDPSAIPYTVGMVITEQPLIHSVGVATASNEVKQFFEKGAPLPARKRDVLKTAFAVSRGNAGDVIRIPVVEGDSPRADRNRRIGVLEIKAHQVKRDVPAGSDVEVTLDMDESRLLRVKAYVPVLDEDFEDVITLGYEKTDAAEVAKALEAEKRRLEDVRKKAEATDDDDATEAIARIDAERMVFQVEGGLVAASGDPDAAQKARNRLGDLRAALDQVEDAVEWPAMVAEADRMTSAAREVLKEHGERGDLGAIEAHEAEIKAAVQAKDPDILRRRLDELRGTVFRILDRKGIMQVMWFRNLLGMIDQMRDRSLAEQLVARGRRAMDGNDVEGMRAVNRQLAGLLPTAPPPPDLSTVL